MNLHPEYNDMLMDFYAKLYDKCPIDVDEVLISNIIKEEKKLDGGVELDEMIWNLGLSLPSWDDDSASNNGKQ